MPEHPRLYPLLLEIRCRLEIAILMTPSGQLRNTLTDANIHMGKAIQDYEQFGGKDAVPEL